MVPGLVLPERDSKSSAEKESSAKGQESGKEYEELLNSVNEALGLDISSNSSVATIKDLMIAFVEREKAEKEECAAQCSELRKLLKAERESHADTKRRLKLAHESASKLLGENKAMKGKIEELESQQSEMSEQRGRVSKGSKAKLVPEFELDSRDSVEESKSVFKKRDTIGLNQPVPFLSNL